MQVQFDPFETIYDNRDFEILSFSCCVSVRVPAFSHWCRDYSVDSCYNCEAMQQSVRGETLHALIARTQTVALFAQ